MENAWFGGNLWEEDGEREGIVVLGILRLGIQGQRQKSWLELQDYLSSFCLCQGFGVRSDQFIDFQQNRRSLQHLPKRFLGQKMLLIFENSRKAYRIDGQGDSTRSDQLMTCLEKEDKPSIFWQYGIKIEQILIKCEAIVHIKVESTSLEWPNNLSLLERFMKRSYPLKVFAIVSCGWQAICQSELIVSLYLCYLISQLLRL